MVLKARVENSAGGILLRIASSQGGDEAGAAKMASVLAAAGLPNDPAARAALAALLSEGAAPEGRALARVRRAALRDGESGGDGADIAAKMEAKGMIADDAAVSEILSLLDGRGGGDRGGGAWGREGRGGGQSPDGKGTETQAEERQASGAELTPPEPVDPEKDFHAEVPEDELPRYLGALIRAIATRSGGEANALTLFNRLRGSEGSWVLVPFRFELDAVDFTGSFRIQLPYVRGGQGRFEAFFSASRGSSTEDWSFFAGFGGGRAPSLRIVPPSGGTAAGRARSSVDSLAALLAVHSCSVRIEDRSGDLGGAPSDAERAGFDLNA